jgi:hypothetical protein
MTAVTIIARRLGEEHAGEVRRVVLERVLGLERSIEDRIDEDDRSCWMAAVTIGSDVASVRLWKDETVACTCDEWREGALCPHVAYVVLTVHPWLVGGYKAISKAASEGVQ